MFSAALWITSGGSYNTLALTYRNSYLKMETVVTWDQLKMQFGSGYSRERDFKAAFTLALAKVRVVYPTAKIQPVATGIRILPSAPHISKKGRTLSIG